jgi:hypothetical protein
MDILGKARRLESSLARSLDHAARRIAKPGMRQPLEIVHAVLHTVESQLEPAGRGAHVFPFNRITVLVAADGRDSRSRYEAVFSGDPSIEHRIVECLTSAGCETKGLEVRTTFVTHAGANWANREFHIEFDRVTEPPLQTPSHTSALEPLKLTTVSGTTPKPAYVFTLGRVNLGRCSEVRDEGHRLIRTNHVAFADHASGPDHTVSRRHAHIDYVVASGHYRLCDDGSAHGTSIIRHGKTIQVPAGSRGIRLQSGDEIVLGDARVRVRLD